MRRNLLILLCVCASAGALAASNAASDAAGDSAPMNVVRYWSDAGPIVPLERASMAEIPAGRGMPASWEIAGTRAAVRIKRGPALLFLVRLPDGVRADEVQLFRLTGSSARRPYAPGTSWRTVALSVSSAGDSYGLAPVGELNEGEYAFVRAGSNDAYCFGVDPAN